MSSYLSAAQEGDKISAFHELTLHQSPSDYLKMKGFTALNRSLSNVSYWPRAVSYPFIVDGCNGHFEFRHQKPLTGAPK